MHVVRNIYINTSRRNVFPHFCLLFILLTASCTAPVTDAPPAVETGTFNLFLQPLPQEARRLSFSVAEMAALRDDGTLVPMTLRQRSFSAGDREDMQIKLVSTDLPPGHYLGVQLHVEKASLNGEEGKIDLLTVEPLSAKYDFMINEEQSETIFMSLSPERLVTDGAFFTPKISLWKPEQMLSNLKGFISNQSSNSLTVFNKRSVLVTDSMQIGKRPQDMVLDKRRGRLYVALAGEDLIAVIEVSNGTTRGYVRLHFGDVPTELALSTSGKRLLVLNQRSNSVSIIDTDSLAEVGRIRLDSAANDIFMGRSEKVAYVVHSIASSLSVLDLDSISVRATATLGDAPLEGVVSGDGKTIYLTTDSSADLLAVNSDSLLVKKKIFVGHGARTVALGRVDGLLYVGKQNGEIAVVDPRALTAIDFYVLPGPIRSLVIDTEENTLFAVLPQSGHLLKLDLGSKRLLGMLELESVSHSVVTMGGI